MAGFKLLLAAVLLILPSIFAQKCDRSQISSAAAFCPCCDPSATCGYVKGKFECVCDNGFNGDGFNCTEVDECALGTDSCDHPSKGLCIKTPGSYFCQCLPGFYSPTLDGKRCADINECNGTNTCDSPGSGGECVNTQGSYNCICESGFYSPSADGRNCTDVNECQLGRDSCHPLSDGGVCINTIGSHSCQCQPGFYNTTVDGKKCADINECNGMNTCDSPGSGGDCVNTPGSYDCLCKSGFNSTSADGRNCTDVDECQLGLDSCHPPSDGGVCINTIGSYSCQCQPGFYNTTVDGKKCADINECNGMNTCDSPGSGGDCVNTPGSYNCICESGFYSPSADGRNCTDLDECTNGKNMCDSYQNGGECQNTMGSYVCRCRAGFDSLTGDGRNCMATANTTTTQTAPTTAPTTTATPTTTPTPTSTTTTPTNAITTTSLTNTTLITTTAPMTTSTTPTTTPAPTTSPTTTSATTTTTAPTTTSTTPTTTPTTTTTPTNAITTTSLSNTTTISTPSVTTVELTTRYRIRTTSKPSWTTPQRISSSLQGGNNFLSYGTQAGDRVQSPTDDACSISFNYDLVFYGTTYSTLFVCTNGVLSFPVANPSYTPESFPLPLGKGLIAPYWTDLFPGKRGLGNVYARYTTNAEHLRQASQLVQEGFRTPFNGDRMVVATWDNLPAYLDSVRGEVRFQCLLITDDYRGTYVVYLYDYLGFSNGYTGSAQVGFDAGNGRTFYAVQGSRSSSIVNLVRTSNVGKPGIWMFNLGADTIGTPPDQDECTNPSLNNCPYNCVDLASGYVCTCPSGMYGDGYNCSVRTNNTVIQEESYCNDSRMNNCPYDCMDLPGGFTCKCPSGYDGDGFTCAVRINECANSSINSCPYACTDLPIGYRCDCFFGFIGDGYNCRVDDRTNWSNSTWLIGNSTSDDSSVLGCPSDYAVHLPSSLSSIRVTWSLPEIVDGESLSCVSCPHNSRAFTIGNHTINYQYRSSRYPYRIYSCSFEIAILGSQFLHRCRQANETRLVTDAGEKTATFITDEGYDKRTTIELPVGSHEIYTNFSSGLVCLHTVHVFDSEPTVQYVGLMAAYPINCNKVGTIEMQVIMSFVYHKVTELSQSCPASEVLEGLGTDNFKGCQINVLSPKDITYRCTDFRNQTDLLGLFWKTNLEIPAANMWSQDLIRLRYIESLISRFQAADPTGRLLEITVISLTPPLLSPMKNPSTGLYLTPQLVSTCQSQELAYNIMTGLCELR